jgi:ParB-like chromosome segregation protein Spo0J
MPNQQKIKLADIVVDDDLQPRAGMNLETIEDYADDMRRGDQFPPVVVFSNGTGSYWLADGFHRLRAAQELEQRVADQIGEIERMGRLRRFLPPQVADLIVA